MSNLLQPIGVIFVSLVCCFHVASLPAAERAATDKLSPAESEYVALATDFDNRLEEFWNQLDKLHGVAEVEKHYAEHNPAIEYLPKFLAFERTHAGQDVSVDALSAVVNYAARGGDEKSPGFTARREVLLRLPRYETSSLPADTIRRLNYGTYDPQVVTYLRRLANTSNANPTLRAIAQLALAQKLLDMRAYQRLATKQLQDVDAGMPTRDPQEEEYFRKYLASLPPTAELEAGRTEAISLLESLAASGDSLRQPVYRSIDPTNHLRRIDVEKTRSSTPLSVKAAALLFEERHLRLGQLAPNLDLKLIDGRRWSLADQRGRVVVIQFSYTGCGPCAEMYPDLRKLAAEFGDRLSIITILRDETPDHGLAETRDGTLTWNVACDGTPGEICTRWAVDGFPEVYVLDPAGQIVANGPRGEQLNWQVAQLIAASKK